MKIDVQNHKQDSSCDALKERCRRSGGFSLISLSLFIVVLGAFAVAGIALSKQYGWAKKQDAGLVTVAQIEDALKNYRALNGTLPCPALMTTAPDAPGFGVAN